MRRTRWRRQLDELKERAPIELLVEHLGGEIGRPGRSGWTAVNCPFHDDEHASAAVSPDSQYFTCTACDAAGDVFKLVQRAGLAQDFQGAVRWVEQNMIPLAGYTTGSS